MNEYSNNLVRNNMNPSMANNEYKIRISSLPQPKMVYDYRKDMTGKIKTALVAAAIAAAALGGVAYQTHIQQQNAEAAYQVVYSEDLHQYPGIKFEIMRNGTGYFVDEQGNRFGQIDRTDAQQRANQYIASGYINLPGKTK